MQQEEGITPYLFVGNYACLDFINTVYMYNGQRVDKLQTFSDLADWMKEAGLIGRNQWQKSRELWGNTPQGEWAVEKAQKFRDGIRSIAERPTEDHAVPAFMIEEINFYLRLGRALTEVQKTPDGNYVLQTYRELNDPLQLLVPIAESVAKLLASNHLPDVKKCENPNCILLFYDKSKNHSRRWCSMEACGNRMKAVAHYRRQRNNEQN